MTEAVEGDFLQTCPFQHSLEHVQDAIRGDGASSWGREDIFTSGSLLHLPEEFYCAGSYRDISVGIFCFQRCFYD